MIQHKGLLFKKKFDWEPASPRPPLIQVLKTLVQNGKGSCRLANINSCRSLTTPHTKERSSSRMTSWQGAGLWKMRDQPLFHPHHYPCALQTSAPSDYHAPASTETLPVLPMHPLFFEPPPPQRAPSVTQQLLVLSYNRTSRSLPPHGKPSQVLNVCVVPKLLYWRQRPRKGTSGGPSGHETSPS